MSIVVPNSSSLLQLSIVLDPFKFTVVGFQGEIYFFKFISYFSTISVTILRICIQNVNQKGTNLADLHWRKGGDCHIDS